MLGKALFSRQSLKVCSIADLPMVFHGEDSDGSSIDTLSDAKGEDTKHSKQGESRVQMKPGDERDTAEFFMDIGNISSGIQTWSSDCNKDNKNGKIISTEEASALSLLSQRELSDHLCSRVALRISF
jgi:hypothetical protein